MEATRYPPQLVFISKMQQKPLDIVTTRFHISNAKNLTRHWLQLILPSSRVGTLLRSIFTSVEKLWPVVDSKTQTNVHFKKGSQKTEPSLCLQRGPWGPRVRETQNELLHKTKQKFRSTFYLLRFKIKSLLYLASEVRALFVQQIALPWAI